MVHLEGEPMTNPRPKVLFVDDEINVLRGIARTLHAGYDVHTATGGEEALAKLAADGPFAAVVSDMRMPGMDGAAFLQRAFAQAPDTVRLLLTGQSDMDAAVSAINDGRIFRFLTKPCPVATLTAAVAAAVEQHRLITAEKDLLEQTLRGAVTALVETLALTHPLAFGRALRLKKRAGELAAALPSVAVWPIEVAAMLSQLGSAALPTPVIEKLHHGDPLRGDEKEMVDRSAHIADTLVGHLPRLERVREILRNQRKGFDGSGAPYDSLAGEAIPLGARLLRVVDDYDVLEARGHNPQMILQVLRSREGLYDPTLLQLVEELWVSTHDPGMVVRELKVNELRVGMILASDVFAANGMLLVTHGHEVTVSLVERLRNFARIGVREPLLVRAA
jgi:response regulator RpfG family c-di-GMP phosphodiesterase